MTVWVVLPAWNESEVIRPALLALAGALDGWTWHAVLVDDGSVDGTVDEAHRAVAERGGALPLTVLTHAHNQGLGAALRTGIYWCLDHAAGEDVVVTLDADLTHPPALIPDLLKALDGNDLAIASRYRAGSAVRGVPGYRRMLSDAGRRVFAALFPIPGVRDYTCCFRAYRVPLLRRARLAWGESLCTARGFEAVMDLLLRLRLLDVRAVEIGFVLDYGGRVGHSKMKVLRTIRTTVSLLARRWVERHTVDHPSRVRARLAAAERRAGAPLAGAGFERLSTGGRAAP